MNESFRDTRPTALIDEGEARDDGVLVEDALDRLFAGLNRRLLHLSRKNVKTVS